MTARRKRLRIEARSESQGMQVLSLLALLVQKYNYDSETKAPAHRGALGVAGHAGPQFTCFTGTKVHVLTLRAA
jgi:hypothetical protein